MWSVGQLVVVIIVVIVIVIVLLALVLVLVLVLVLLLLLLLLLLLRLILRPLRFLSKTLFNFKPLLLLSGNIEGFEFICAFRFPPVQVWGAFGKHFDAKT